MMRQLPVAAALLCFSCGPSDSRPTAYPVRGSVFLDGRPAPGARVILHSLDAGADGVRPHGRVEADGSFRLSTYRAFDGAPAGRYAVTVYWRLPNPDDDEEEGPQLLPGRYLSPVSSGLEAVVKPEANELGPFRLSSK